MTSPQEDAELREQIAQALELVSGKDAAHMRLKKDAPAAQHFYLESEEWDDEYEHIIGYTYLNFEQRINEIMQLIKARDEQREREILGHLRKEARTLEEIKSYGTGDKELLVYLPFTTEHLGLTNPQAS